MSSLPTRTDISGASSKATAQAAFTAIYDYLSGLFGPTGTAAAARAALGVADTGGNRLINGAGNINQLLLVSPVTLAAGQYGHDGFKGGAAGCTYSFTQTANVTIFTITAGSLIQIADGKYLRTENHVLSWAGTAQGKIGAGAYSASGVSAALTGGTNTNVEFNSGTVSLMQLEPGTVPTPYEFRRDELFRCQEYYEDGELDMGTAYPTGGVGALLIASIFFKRKKTSIPAMGQLGSSTSSNITSNSFGAATTTGCPVTVVQGGAAGNFSLHLGWSASNRL